MTRINCTGNIVKHTWDFPSQNYIKDTVEGVGVGMETKLTGK